MTATHIAGLNKDQFPLSLSAGWGDSAPQSDAESQRRAKRRQVLRLLCLQGSRALRKANLNRDGEKTLSRERNIWTGTKNETHL